jgi:hypothetical protein
MLDAAEHESLYLCLRAVPSILGSHSRPRFGCDVQPRYVQTLLAFEFQKSPHGVSMPIEIVNSEILEARNVCSEVLR